MAETKQEFFMYKEKPFVRSGDTIYYGDMADPYVIMMQIKSKTKFKEMDLADDVTIQLMRTDPDVRPQDMIVKKSEKKGFYNALDIASVWLKRALEKE